MVSDMIAVGESVVEDQFTYRISEVETFGRRFC